MSFLSPTFYCFVLVDVSAFDPSVHLAWGDVSISGDNQVLRVFLKRSKTDQYGRGTEVFIGVTRDELCPIQAVRSYVAVCGESPGAFFRSLDGCPLSKARFVELVRSTLARAGVPIAGYSGHSFRIGAATAAAQAGVPVSAIQALGRWSSPAFLHYIRVPREHLAQYSTPLYFQVHRRIHTEELHLKKRPQKLFTLNTV